jgi:hypothetical protein
VKRSFLVQIAICSALAVGCSKSNEPLKFQTKANSPARTPTPTQQAQMTPEFVIDHMESPQETANYLKGLAKDPSFDPKQHADMLKQYSGNSNPQVASAAKELADKAQ